jgi:hypothetical protein
MFGLRGRLWLIVAGFCGSSLATADIAITPRVEFGQQDYTIDFKGTIPTPEGFVQTSTAIKLDPFLYRYGLTFTHPVFFVDGYYQTTNEDAVTQFFTNAAESWVAKTNEFNLTFGAFLTNSDYIFCGYRDHSQRAKGRLGSSYELSHDGYFVGGGHVWRTTQPGSSISFSIGYAWLDVVIKENLFGTKIPDAWGSSRGLKYGLVWRSQLADRISYTLSIDSYRYRHDLKNRMAGASLRIHEEEISMRLGLAYTY